MLSLSQLPLTFSDVPALTGAHRAYQLKFTMRYNAPEFQQLRLSQIFEPPLLCAMRDVLITRKRESRTVFAEPAHGSTGT